MKLSLIDLVVIVGLFVVGSLTVSALLPLAHATHTTAFAFTLLGGVVAVLWLTWPIFRHFHFRPLCLPVCPNCRRIPEAYGVAYARWPSAILVCTKCETPLEIWMTRTPGKGVSTKMPSFYLLWPEFFGLWRQAAGTNFRVNSDGRKPL